MYHVSNGPRCQPIRLDVELKRLPTDAGRRQYAKIAPSALRTKARLSFPYKLGIETKEPPDGGELRRYLA